MLNFIFPCPWFNSLLQELVYQRKKFFTISLKVPQPLMWKTLAMRKRMQFGIPITYALQVSSIKNCPYLIFLPFQLEHHLIWNIFLDFASRKGSAKWVKVNEKRTLHDVLKEPNFIIQGIPGASLISQLNLKLCKISLSIKGVTLCISISITCCLCMFISPVTLVQSFMLFLKSPTSIKSSKLVYGLLRHE